MLLPNVAALRDFVSGRASPFEGDLTRDRAFLDGALERIFVYPDGAIVLRFREDGLFGPVESYEIHAMEGAEPREPGTVPMEVQRCLMQRAIDDARADGTERVVVLDPSGLASANPEGRGGLPEKAFSVPSGI